MRAYTTPKTTTKQRNGEKNLRNQPVRQPVSQSAIEFYDFSQEETHINKNRVGRADIPSQQRQQQQHALRTYEHTCVGLTTRAERKEGIALW